MQHDDPMHGAMGWAAALAAALVLAGVLVLLGIAFALGRRVRQRVVERIGTGAGRLARRPPPPRPDAQDAFEALLLIPDITGYTHFMEISRFALGHAQYLVSELLAAMMDAGGDRLHTLKIEGDAVFMYAPLRPGEPDPRLGQAIAGVLAAFYRRQRQLAQANVCGCAACSALGQLDIKAVAASGPVLFHAVGERRELSGLPVIAVHRLLKAAVGAPRYLLMTARAAERVPVSGMGPPQSLAPHLHGLAEMECVVYSFELADLPEQEPAPPAGVAEKLADLWRKLLASLRTLRPRPDSPATTPPGDAGNHRIS